MDETKEKEKDITTDEIMPHLTDASDQNKGLKKIQKLGDRLLEKVNGRINGERDILRRKLQQFMEEQRETVKSWTTDINSQIERFEKKYEGMYSHLVRKFLVDLENRVFTNEIFTQGLLDVVVRRLYVLEGQEEKGVSYDDYVKKVAKEHEEKMQALADDVAKKQQSQSEAAKEAQGVEQSDQQGDKSDEAESQESENGESSPSSQPAEGRQGHEVDTEGRGAVPGGDGEILEQEIRG